MACIKIAILMFRILFIILVLWSGALFAVEPSLKSIPINNERLSDWLLRQNLTSDSYLSGVAWVVPETRLAQGDHKRKLLEKLDYSENVSSTLKENLYTLIKSLPITGRVPIPNADPRWLQAHPKEDPVLSNTHSVVLPTRPSKVIIIQNDGQQCILPHLAGQEARSYVLACGPKSFERIDYIWIIQPNGTIRQIGVANWNIQAQDELAPGSIVWAPFRGTGWSDQFSSMFAKLLSTQGFNTFLDKGQVAVNQSAFINRTSRPARDAEITASDWGTIGLLQTPSARMSKAGEARFNYSNVYPYDRYNIFFQPLDSLEFGFRYTNITNQLYGPAELSGSQTYKDKSLDFKARLIEETAIIPQIAVGMIDLTGTGFFSSEYLVANKRFGNFDWSMGLGWGYLGSSNNITNPASMLFGKSFNTRQADVGQGGTIPTGVYFRGNTAAFGGVQYHTPFNKWLFKLEYDGNNYQQEPLGYKPTQKTPINAGVIYRYTNTVDFSMGLERGNTFMLGITLHTPLNKLNTPKISDPPALEVFRSRPSTEPNWLAIATDMTTYSGWSVRQIAQDGKTLHVVIDSAYGAHFNDRLERVIAILHRNAPAVVEEFSLVFIERGMPMTQRIITREPWVKNSLELPVPDDSFQTTPFIYATEPKSPPIENPLWESDQASFGYSIIPTWQQNLGGPDGFILFRGGVSAPMIIRLSEDTLITGGLSIGLFDNYGKFKYTAPSNLPRVRTFLREYMTTSQVYLPNLQITHSGKLASDQYYSFYGGYLESMFAGAGAEWLYRPWHSPLAFGIDINQVQQRSFEQDLSFDNAGTQTGYRVATGHARAYWDTGWESVNVKLSVGRYLAGDIGATVNVGRAFDNGVTLGAWVTKTNVSAEKFGEGSFDKGIYLTIPFDVMTSTRGSGVANLVYQPLTRDGGSQLNRSLSLYDATNARNKRQTSFFPADMFSTK